MDKCETFLTSVRNLRSCLGKLYPDLVQETEAVLKKSGLQDELDTPKKQKEPELQKGPSSEVKAVRISPSIADKNLCTDTAQVYEDINNVLEGLPTGREPLKERLHRDKQTILPNR